MRNIMDYRIKKNKLKLFIDTFKTLIERAKAKGAKFVKINGLYWTDNIIIPIDNIQFESDSLLVLKSENDYVYYRCDSLSDKVKDMKKSDIENYPKTLCTFYNTVKVD